ncbi:MAG: hypothetical protein AVDCRST_MAG60-689, partial [uncultured Nocardioides sp.]
VPCPHPIRCCAGRRPGRFAAHPPGHGGPGQGPWPDLEHPGAEPDPRPGAGTRRVREPSDALHQRRPQERRAEAGALLRLLRRPARRVVVDPHRDQRRARPPRPGRHPSPVRPGLGGRGPRARDAPHAGHRGQRVDELAVAPRGPPEEARQPRGHRHQPGRTGSLRRSPEPHRSPL